MSLIPQTANSESRQVLIVDDDEVARFIIAKWLRMWNISATFCKDANTAIERYKQRHYCLAIIDYYLPDQNGLELIQEMRRTNGNGCETTFALHSTDLELHHVARRNSISYFLPKPFTNGALYNILRESSCHPQQVKHIAEEHYVGDYDEARRPLKIDR